MWPFSRREKRDYTEVTWESIFDRSSKAKTGVRVDEDTAIYSSAVAAVIGLRAKTRGSLPTHVYRKSDDGRKEASEHPASRLLRGKPNSHQTASKFWRWKQITQDITGNAYVWMETRGSRLVGLHPIVGKTEPILSVKHGIVTVEGYKNTYKGVETLYPAREVLHFPSEFISADGVTGRSLIDVCRESIGIDMGAEEFFSRVLANGTHMGVVLVADEGLTDKQFQDLKQQMADGRGVTPAGKTRVFNRVKPMVLGMSVKDADLTEQRRFALERICGVFGVPPNFAGDLEKLTYSNAEQADIQLAKHCIRPIVVDDEQLLTSELLSADASLYVKFDLKGLERGDFKTRMEGYSAAVNAGIMIPNEPRELEDMEPVPGGDVLRFPVNTIPADIAYDYFAKSSDALDPVADDIRSRIRTRVKRDGDTERTRDFARIATDPLASAYAKAGRSFDSSRFIEEAING